MTPVMMAMLTPTLDAGPVEAEVGELYAVPESLFWAVELNEWDMEVPVDETTAKAVVTCDGVPPEFGLR